MIDLYYWTTPNGYKVAMFLEESGAPHRLIPIDIIKGEQLAADFASIAPNRKIPAIVDHEPEDGGAPISVFESGAILLYLAEKLGRFLPQSLRVQVRSKEWLFWQMAGLGPTSSQLAHYARTAKEKIPYAIERFTKETLRLYGVLNHELGSREYLAGEYSIADMAVYPWVVPHEALNIPLQNFPHVRRWFDAIAARPATARAYQRAAQAAAAKGSS